MTSQTETRQGTDKVTSESRLIEQSRFGTFVKRISMILVTIALIVGFLQYKYSLLSQIALQFLGPPQVELQETFAHTNAHGVFDHDTFQSIISTRVDTNGWVDYEAMKRNETQLDAYLHEIAEANIDSLGRNERLAFLINAYNAFTLKLILENYPLKTIKDIPTEQRWDAVRWDLAGSSVSLSQIEHELIRPNFVEPRVHFALVCAAVGCPPLRNEAYSGERLDDQLNDQTTYVHAHVTWFQFDSNSNQLSLTQLYNWYRNDFVQAEGSLLGFVSTNASEVKENLDSINSNGIHWLPYDWSLNDIKNRASR